MTRIRKAYEIHINGCPAQIVYARTAAKARSEIIGGIVDSWSITWREAMDEITSCRRAPSHDKRLPDRHPLAASLHPKILHNVTHAYGGTGLKAGHRDHFYADKCDWTMKAALYEGLFSAYRRDKGRDGRPDMIMYELTELGRNVAAGEVRTYPECWE